MNNEVVEALRSAQELCEFLWNNVDTNIDIVAHSDAHAKSLSALLNDTRGRVETALHGLEIQQSDCGATKAHGPVGERLMKQLYGARR